MGTRADFYVGKGRDAEWIGSVGYDGYREGINGAVLAATDETTFRAAVAAFLERRDDATVPDQGWPWPWDTSATSDCSYWFFDSKVWEELNGAYLACSENPDDHPDTAGLEKIDFPDMSAKKNVTFGPRSGLMIITSR